MTDQSESRVLKFGFYGWLIFKSLILSKRQALKVAQSQNNFHFSKKKVPNSSPEHLLFGWIVLGGEIWYLFLEIRVKEKYFLRFCERVGMKYVKYTVMIKLVIHFIIRGLFSTGAMGALAFEFFWHFITVRRMSAPTLEKFNWLSAPAILKS